MTKTIISNPYQSQNRQNLLKAGGLKNIDDTITPKNGERIYGKVGEVRFNQLAQNNGNDTGTITPPDCPDCPPIDPPTDPDNPTPDTPQGCTCRSLDELGDYIAQKASESFCENTPVEDDNQYFPCLTGADGGELRISCPNDENCETQTGTAYIYLSKELYLGNREIEIIPETFLNETIENISYQDFINTCYNFLDDALYGYIDYGNRLRNCEYRDPRGNPYCIDGECACISNCHKNKIIIEQNRIYLFIQFNCNKPSTVNCYCSLSASFVDNEGNITYFKDIIDTAKYGEIRL